jgi:phospholipase/carboxylesterase
MQHKKYLMTIVCIVALMCIAMNADPYEQQKDARSEPAPARDSVIFAKAGILLPVYLKMPRDYDPSRPAVLVVAMHGKGGTAQGMLPMWNAFDNPRFILAVAEAPYPLSGGWSWDFPSRDQSLWEIADPLISDYILNVVQNIKARYQIASVYLFGHSQGVGYAYLTGLLHPDQIRGLICFAGIYPKDIWPKDFLPSEKLKSAVGMMRFFIAHGRDDNMIGVESSEQAKNILESMGAVVSFFKFNGAHNLPDEALREVQKWIEADMPQQNHR